MFQKGYVKYFALCPGLSYFLSPLNTHGCGREIFETTSFSSLAQASLATQIKNLLGDYNNLNGIEANTKYLLIFENVFALDKMLAANTIFPSQ